MVSLSLSLSLSLFSLCWIAWAAVLLAMAPIWKLHWFGCGGILGFGGFYSFWSKHSHLLGKAKLNASWRLGGRLSPKSHIIPESRPKAECRTCCRGNNTDCILCCSVCSYRSCLRPAFVRVFFERCEYIFYCKYRKEPPWPCQSTHAIVVVWKHSARFLMGLGQSLWVLFDL